MMLWDEIKQVQQITSFTQREDSLHCSGTDLLFKDDVWQCFSSTNNIYSVLEKYMSFSNSSPQFEVATKKMCNIWAQTTACSSFLQPNCNFQSKNMKPMFKCWKVETLKDSAWGWLKKQPKRCTHQAKKKLLFTAKVNMFTAWLQKMVWVWMADFSTGTHCTLICTGSNSLVNIKLWNLRVLTLLYHFQTQTKLVLVQHFQFGYCSQWATNSWRKCPCCTVSG